MDAIFHFLEDFKKVLKAIGIDLAYIGDLGDNCTKAVMITKGLYAEAEIPWIPAKWLVAWFVRDSSFTKLGGHKPSEGTIIMLREMGSVEYGDELYEINGTVIKRISDLEVEVIDADTIYGLWKEFVG